MRWVIHGEGEVWGNRWLKDIAAAARELEEETGWRADGLTLVGLQQLLLSERG